MDVIPSDQKEYDMNIVFTLMEWQPPPAQLEEIPPGLIEDEV